MIRGYDLIDEIKRREKQRRQLCVETLIAAITAFAVAILLIVLMFITP